ncbi:MAG: response regulator transcription factor [Candidatus Zipacnadales bacterium]
MAKILVVDDDPDIVEAMRLVLEGSNHEVATAASAAEAEQQTVAVKPDLILLDIMMPEGTEGFQFVWKLRNQLPEEVRETPVVVLSAIHSKVDLRFYPEQSDGTYEPGEYLPVQGFIDKPAAPQELLKKVAEVLAAQK